MRVVFVELNRCIACLNCERTCLFQNIKNKKGTFPTIFVDVDMDRRQIFTGTCLQCEHPACMAVCPTDALNRDSLTTAVVVDRNLCLGCGLCVEACPYGYIRLDDDICSAIKCDLCNGAPKCVQMCMAEALHFGSLKQLAQKKKMYPGLMLGLRAIPGVENDHR